MTLLNDKSLEASNIVANCLMNRERRAFGDNSYEKEIFINPYYYLKDRMQHQETVCWLDFCCGRGKAIIQLMTAFQKEGIDHRFQFIGVDLIEMGDPMPTGMINITLTESSIHSFETDLAFDLITCVHGMHYIGDKLKAIKQYSSYLKEDGLFLCNLDTNTLFDKAGKKLGRKINADLKMADIDYSSQKKMITVKGKKKICLPYTYLGADDTHGKNYTGQKVVASYYECECLQQ